jgi:hypothetical protein
MSLAEGLSVVTLRKPSAGADHVIYCSPGGGARGQEIGVSVFREQPLSGLPDQPKLGRRRGPASISQANWRRV